MNPRRVIAAGFLLIGLLTSRAFARESEPVCVLHEAPGSILMEEPFVRQCELGSAVSDAVRVYAETDIALINAGDLVNDLNDGPVSRTDIEHVFAADRTLATASLTPEELRELLEHAVAQVSVDTKTEQLLLPESRFDGFCQISGFCFRYDASAPPGERVIEITWPDGKPLDEPVSVCATGDMLGGAYGFSPMTRASIDATLSDALETYLRLHTAFPDMAQERIRVIGIRVPMLGTGITRGILFAGSALLIGFLAFYRMRRKNYEEEYGEKEGDIETLTRDSYYRGRKH